jgi:hypothetical protein
MNGIKVRVSLWLDGEGATHLDLALDNGIDAQGVGRWLRRLREADGQSAAGVAANLGHDTESVERLERGDGDTPLFRLASVPPSVGGRSVP